MLSGITIVRILQCSIALVAWVFLARSVTIKSPSEPRCASCRYSLVGLTLPCVCPECGTSNAEDRAIQVRYRWTFDRWWFATLTALACAICTPLVIPFWWLLYCSAGYRGRVSLEHVCFNSAGFPTDGFIQPLIVLYLSLLLLLAFFCPYENFREARRLAVFYIGTITAGVLFSVWIGWQSGAIFLEQAFGPTASCCPFILPATAVGLVGLHLNRSRKAADA